MFPTSRRILRCKHQQSSSKNIKIARYARGWDVIRNERFERLKALGFEGGVHTAAFVYYPKSPKLEKARGLLY